MAVAPEDADRIRVRPAHSEIRSPAQHRSGFRAAVRSTSNPNFNAWNHWCRR